MILQVPETRLQVVELNVPVLFVVNVTVPVGVVADVEVSVTVAVQVVLIPTVTDPGVHMTEVVVEWTAAAEAARRNAPWLGE